MATYTTWGPWAPSSGASRRMRLRYDWGMPEVGAQDDSVTVTLTVSAEVGYSVSWRNATLTWSGDFAPSSASVNVIAPTGGSVVLHRLSGEFPIRTSPYAIYASMSLSGVGYVGATATHTDTLRIPAQGATRPSAPAWVKTERIGSDGTAFRISWPAVTGADYYRLGVWRESTQSFGVIGRVYGTSAEDVMPLDDQYRYAVDAWNSAGDSAWEHGEYVRTRPAPPRLSWSRAGGEITVRIDAQARYPMGTRLQWRTKGQDWQTLTSIPGGSGIAPHTPPVGAAVQYRADCWVTQPTITYSSWAETEWIQALAKPGVPSPLAPVGTIPADDVTRLTWRHNPVDGTAQTAAELQYRRLGQGAWTQATTTTATTHEVQLPAGWWEWQVRTRGAHADWSDWSPVAGFRIAARPDLIIKAPPSGTWKSNRVELLLEYSDTTGAGMASWEVTLRDADGAELERITGRGLYTPRRLTTVLRNHTDYVIVAVARSGTGLQSQPAEVRITTDFALPAAPSLEAHWVEEEGIVTLEARAGTEPAGAPATVELRLECSYDGGVTWSTLATGPGPALAGSDPLPPLGSEPVYRAVAASDLPSEAMSPPIAVATRTGRVWLVGDDGTRAYLLLDRDLSVTREHELVLATYEGDICPTPHYGPGRAEQAQLSGLLTARHGSPMNTWLRLLGQPVWLRDPAAGIRWHATIAPGGVAAKPRRGRSGALEISATITRITDD